MDTIQEIFNLPNWRKHEPPTAEQLQELEARFGPLPADYKAIMEQSNGGSLTGYRTPLIFWPINEVIGEHKDGFLYTYIPGAMIFGNDGGDTLFCFDLRPGKGQQVFLIREGDSSGGPDNYHNIRSECPSLTETIQLILKNYKLD